MISHVVILYGFCYSWHPIQSVMIVQYCFWRRPHLYNRWCSCPIFIINYTRSYVSWQLNFVFGVDRSYTISHVIVLSSFHHKSRLVWLVMITQFHFRHRPHLYDQSHQCRVWFLLQTTPGQIDLDSSVSILAWATLIWLVMSLSHLVFIIN